MSVKHPYLAGPYPRAFAHRGWHTGELAGFENSLRALRRAVDEGFRYLETDVHATSDGVVVVHHDPVLDRTTDGHGAIADQPWRMVRRARIAGSDPVCRLSDVLEALPGVRLNVDVKSDHAVGPVLDLLHRMNAWSRVCLASFSDARLATLRARAGEQLLTSLGPRSVAGLWLRSHIPWLPGRRGRMPGLAQVPVHRGRLTVVDERLLAHAHRVGLEVHVWTVDDAAEMHRLLAMGVDGLVTDRPDVLRAVLRGHGVWPEAVHE